MIMKYLQIAAVAVIILMGVTIFVLREQNSSLKEEISVLQFQEETTKNNLKLVVAQLDKEAENRRIAEEALSSLSNEVPDVVYKEELPNEIQNVLDRFHDRIRN